MFPALARPMPYVTPARRAAVERLTGILVAQARSLPGVLEGRVRGRNRAGYRRLDCGGRALAFIRGRPSAGGVRIDVSGLWVRASTSALEITKPAGPPALLVRTDRDIAEALAFLRATIGATDRAYAREAARHRLAGRVRGCQDG